MRWYCRYGVSDCDLEQMLPERSAPINYSTIHHRVRLYAPEIVERLRSQWRCPARRSGG
jgi:IS6 family transposase